MMLDTDKYPRNFMAVFAIYLAILVMLIVGFVIPAFSANLWEDSGFYIILLIIFLPLITFLVYTKSSRLPILWGKEYMLRLIIMILCVVSIVFNSVFVLPII